MLYASLPAGAAPARHHDLTHFQTAVSAVKKA
jgi:hypothetical protein